MDTNTGPGIHPPTPGQPSVIASLKRNVLWGVLGLVALVFATVCVMYYTSRQTEAASLDAGPAVETIAPVESAPVAADSAAGGSTALAPIGPIAPATPTTPATGAAAAITTTPVAAPVVAPITSTPAKTAPASEVLPVAKPTVTPTTASVPAKPATKPVAKPAPAPLKVLDAAKVPHGTQIYVVKSGDTLEKIAKTVYGDSQKWTRLAALNKEYVGDINHLKVGQKILVERAVNPRDYADY